MTEKANTEQLYQLLKRLDVRPLETYSSGSVRQPPPAPESSFAPRRIRNPDASTVGSAEMLDYWLALPAVPGTQVSHESRLLLLKLSQRDEPLMRRALAAARHPSLEDILSLADNLSFFVRFLDEQEFADDHRAVALRTKLDAVWMSGHPEAQYSSLRASYATTTRGNLEYWRDELVKAHESLVSGVHTRHAKSDKAAHAHANPDAGEAHGPEFRLDLPNSRFWYTHSGAPPEAISLVVPSQDQLTLYKRALDAAIHPANYTLTELRALQDVLFHAMNQNFPDTGVYHRLLQQGEKGTLRSDGRPDGEERTRALLSTTNGYLFARYQDLAFVTGRLLLEEEGESKHWKPAPWRQRSEP